MDKRKNYDKVVDFAARLVFWFDESMPKLSAFNKKIFAGIVTIAAEAVFFTDIVLMKYDRLKYILKYYLLRGIHKTIRFIEKQLAELVKHLLLFVLAAVALVTIFSYSLGFQYSYNGKVLGYVRNQDDVLRILELVSSQLSEETGSTIQIDEDSDISFKTVFVLNKEIDDTDTVLKRMTYMSDTRAEAAGIFINGAVQVICKDEGECNRTLNRIKADYQKNEDAVYESADFVEDVEIKPVSTKLGFISSSKQAEKIIRDGGVKADTYEVKSGDTFYDITEELGISSKELKELNPGLDEENLYPGDKIYITREVSMLNVVTVERLKYTEKIHYKTEYRKDSDMYENEEKVVQSGENGKRVVVSRITRENGVETKRKELSSDIIKEPVTKIIVKGTKPLPKTAATGDLMMPVPGAQISSYFGWRWGRNHDGIDLAISEGTPIYAADGGTCTFADWYSGYGMYMTIDHGNGVVTHYAHCSKFYVKPGDKVYKGQAIAAVGNTGNSTGPHCHFEVYVNGALQDPMDYL